MNVLPRSHLYAAALLFGAALTCNATPSFAQTRLYVLFAGAFGSNCQPTDCDPGVVVDIDVSAGRIAAVTPVLQARQNGVGPSVTADGRFLLWAGGEFLQRPTYLSVFDLAARVHSTPIVVHPMDTTVALFVHPSAVRAFVQPRFGVDLTVAEPAGTRTLAAPCQQSSLKALSGDGTRLFFICIDAPGSSRTLSVDSATGATVASLSNQNWSYMAIDDSGSSLFTAFWQAVGTPPVFRRYDMASGALLAEHVGAVNDTPREPMAVDPRSGRVYAGTPDGLRLLDGTTLTPLARLTAPIGFANATLAFDPDRPVAYVVWTGVVSGAGYQTRIQLVDTNTFAIVAEAALPSRSRALGIVQGPRPPEVTALTASVAGDVVDLRWTNGASRAIATALTIEAGSTSGAVNLARLPVAPGSSSFRVNGVPPGTYFVRVRSSNGTGTSAPSNEVVVQVGADQK